MVKRDIIVGIVIVALLGGAIYFWQENRQELKVPEETPSGTVEEELEESFNLTLPEDAEKIELQSTAGEDIAGIASRKKEDSAFTLTVLADLPTPEEGKYYQAWLVRGEEEEEDYKTLSAGRLSVAKGGYILNFKVSVEYLSYNKVVVSEEEAPDRQIEEVILEGSF